MFNLVQCNICQKWYSNQHGLLIHLRFCRERHDTEWNDGNHQTCEHNPLKSCYDHCDHLNPWAVYDDDLDNSRMEEGGGGYLTEDDLELYKDEDDDQLANY